MSYRGLRRWIGVVVLLGLLSGGLPGPALAAGPVDGITRRFTTPRYQLEGQSIRVPGTGMNDAPGAPQLPAYGTVIELPAAGDWELSVQTTGSRVLPQRLAIPAVPAPDLSLAGPESWTRRADLPGMVPTTDRPDPTIYRSNAFYPASPAIAGDVQWQRGRRLLAVHVFPFQYNPVTREVRYHPDIEITVRIQESGDGGQGTGIKDQGAGDRGQESGEGTAAPQAADGAVRIRTTARGLYRLTYDDLLAANVPLAGTGAVDPRSFTMTHRGAEVQIQVLGEEDGAFDPGDRLIFYAEPYEGRYMTQNVYRLFWQQNPAPSSSRVATRTVTPTYTEPSVAAITQTLHIEFDRGYYSDYHLANDADHWFDDPLSAYSSASTVTRTYTLTLDDPLTAGNVQVRSQVYGGQDKAAALDQSVALWLNSHYVDTWQWDGRTGYTGSADAPAAWLDAAPNEVKLEAALSQLPDLGDYWVYPDWVKVSYPALPDVEDDRIFIEGIDVISPTAQITVTGFTTETVRVYDVRRPTQPVQLTATEAISDGVSYQLHFWDAWADGEPGASYALATEDALLAPSAVELDQLTDLDTAVVYADYIAIVHHDLSAALQPLLIRRAAQGLRVAEVDVQDIYDDFNDGLVDPEAIRTFLTHAYNSWNPGEERPRYVVLVGNGHYDFKRASGTTAPNQIPPYLIYIDPWIGETAADNRYVSVDGPDDYLPDMAIGRIPARTPAALTQYINKIANYENPAVTPDADWNNRVNFVADDCMNSAGNFHALSDEVRLNWLPGSLDDRTIYFGNTANCPGSTSQTDTTTEMNTQIKAAFNAGTVMLQWFGHASRWRWGPSGIYGWADPPNLAANTRLPLTVVYSCWDGYFIDLDNDYQVLGPMNAMQPGRASIADLSPTGLHIGSALLNLNEGLVLALFRDRIRPIGEATTQAKLYYFANGAAWPDVIDTQMLFGDPALQLRMPATLPTTPTAAIAAKGASAMLSWPHQLDSAQYEVWRSTTPYFDPLAGEGMQVNTVKAGFRGAGPDIEFEDDGINPPPPVTIIGDPATNYFWVLRSRNGDGVSGFSNQVGEFDFSLEPGSE